VTRKKFDKSDWSSALSMWDKYTSPFRPSIVDIDNYFLILKRLKQKRNILLLGATPEIRDILANLGLKVLIADFSQEMLIGMTNHGVGIIESSEKWVKTDWMDMNKFIKNDYFDLILGDLVLRNIEPDSQINFLKEISELLNKNGYFVGRIHFINESLMPVSARRIIESSFEDGYRIKSKSLEDLITSRLFDKATNFKTKRINKRKFANDINGYIKKDLTSKREDLVLNNILKKWAGQRTWTQRTAKEIDRLLFRYFSIRDIRIASDYKDSEFYPLYILRNNKD